MKRQLYFVWIVSLWMWGCAGSPAEDYQAAVDAGWFYYEQGQYSEASGEFVLALQTDATGWEAWSGLGWSRLRRDSLEGATDAFSAGSEQDGVTADIFAGWAFVLNAQKSYVSSTSQAGAAIAMDGAWSFSRETSLNAIDLRILVAENYFALGQFSQSLASVQGVNALFTADINTSAGQASLAAEIERLKSIN